MKNILSATTRSTLLVLIASMILFYFSSCARKVSFQASPVVPAAKGTVTLATDKNENYTIKIALSSLAEPTKLDPSKSIYVVWMETENNNIKNIGQINSSTGFLSDKLKASFETVSSFKPIRIFITAEDNAGIQHPGEQVVLSTSNF